MDPETEYKLHPNDIGRLRMAFETYDTTGQKYLSWEQDFPNLWRAIGCNPTQKDVERLIAENRKEGDQDHFSEDDFLKLGEKVDADNDGLDVIKEETLLEAFRTFDKNGTGTIQIEQLRYILGALGEPLEGELADSFVEFAESKQGKGGPFNYEQLIIHLMERDPGPQYNS
uniref:Calmodulin n=1 Tax=Oxyrrhis marina TaxID=2969 RepID=A0A7S3ULV7_OXYMA